MESAAESLLDFSKDFEFELLDQIVAIANDGAHPQRVNADEFLVKIKDHPDMWKRTYDVLEKSSQETTRFFILQVLSQAIETRWKIFPMDQKTALKNYIVSKVLSCSVDDEMLRINKRFLSSSLNKVLVEILKQDWPHDWPTFITDIVASSKQAESLCENNMKILRLLSEEGKYCFEMMILEFLDFG
jgi:exportin-1